MLKISIINQSKQGIGGGWSFIDNFIKGVDGKAEIVEWQNADIVLIPSASMVDRSLFGQIKKHGGKIILRVDNALRNSRNRNSGMSRMKDFAKQADIVVYQSEWAREYLGEFLERDGVVIYNGIDLDVFKKNGPYKDFGGQPTYLYSRYSRDELKRWETAWYQFQEIYRRNKKAKLVIVGRFSDDIRSGNFDFFNGENYEYLGIIHNKEEMARIYRGCDYLMATYYMDCYSNTYQEAIACGCKLYKPDMSGGTPELIKNGPISCQEMVDNYLEVFNELLS